MTAAYRVWQFFHALTARISEKERDEYRKLLPASAVLLFESLPMQDQRHGFDVMQALVFQGQRDEDVLAAALLHDAGKAGAGLTPVHRSIIVLLQAYRPAWILCLGQLPPVGWRRPFWIHLHHARLGAQLAAGAGCSARTVWLIEHHHDPIDEKLVKKCPDSALIGLLRQLQALDNVH